MTRRLHATILCGYILCGCLSAAAQQRGAAAAAADLAGRANEFLRQLSLRDYKRAAEVFPPAGSNADPAALADWWDEELATRGALVSCALAQAARYGDYEVACARCQFARGAAELQIAYQPRRRTYVPLLVAPIDANLAARPELLTQAKEFIRLYLLGDLTRAAAHLADGNDAAALAYRRATLAQLLGRIRKETGATADPALTGDARLVVVRWEFERADCTFNLTFDAAGQISNFVESPGNPFPAYTTAEYVPRASFVERVVSIGREPWALHGVLTLPGAASATRRVPAVLLVQGGPGPFDQDASAGPFKMFRDLAEGLAARGIAVLRIEKRPYAHFREFYARPDYTLEEETVADARTALAALRHMPEVAPTHVFLLGHSLGGYLAPRVAARSPRLAGIVLLAAPARPFEDVALSQEFFQLFFLNVLGLSLDEKLRLERFKQAVQRVKSLALGRAANSAALPDALPASFWLYLRGYEPTAAAARLRVPLLVMQGSEDYQTTAADFALWQRPLRRRAAQFKFYPGLTHMFMRAPAEPADLGALDHVAPEIVADVATWLMRQSSSPRSN